MRDPRTSFEPVAASYLTSAVHSNPNALDRMIQVVQPKGGIVVDVATGAGHTAYAFAPHVDQVIATDITEAMLKLTRKTAEERGYTNMDFVYALAEDLPFRSQTLTGLTCRMGAHHFNNVPRFVEETFRSTKTGGWFLLVDTIGDEDDEADEQVDHLERVRDPSHRRNLRRSEWVALAEKCGFKVEHHEETTKAIEVEDWMERMRVPEEDRPHLRDLVDNATGKFAEYLQPMTQDGKKFFHLKEMLLFARK
jgi:ubiquinone/menaquinone biosynthesis C-methylase UbiE